MDTDTWKIEQVRWSRALTRADYADSTIDTFIKRVTDYLEWCDQEDHETSALSSADLYVDHVQRSRSPHAARWTARSIKAYGKYLAEEYEEGDPFKKLKLPKEPEVSAKHAAAATHEDVDKLLATCDRSNLLGARDYAIITLLAGSGLRRGEAVGLLMDDIDMVEQRVHIRTGKTKAAKRTLHMQDDVQGAILKYLKHREAKVAKEKRRHSGSVWLENLEKAGNPLWVTHNLGTPGMTPNGFTQTLNKKGKKTGVDIRAHAMRRMHAGDWIAKGLSEVGLMSNSGWKDSTMIARYTRDVQEENAIEEAKRLRV